MWADDDSVARCIPPVPPRGHECDTNTETPCLHLSALVASRLYYGLVEIPPPPISHRTYFSFTNKLQSVVYNTTHLPIIYLKSAERATSSICSDISGRLKTSKTANHFESPPSLLLLPSPLTRSFCSLFFQKKQNTDHFLPAFTERPRKYHNHRVVDRRRFTFFCRRANNSWHPPAVVQGLHHRQARSLTGRAGG